MFLNSESFPPCVTAVAHKRPQSFCQKCRWQVTPKQAHTLDPTKSEWADYAAVQFLCVFFLVIFDQCCWLVYSCWLPSRALLSSLLLSCCMQSYCEALRAQTRRGALEVLFIIIIIPITDRTLLTITDCTVRTDYYSLSCTNYHRPYSTD